MTGCYDSIIQLNLLLAAAIAGIEFPPIRNGRHDGDVGHGHFKAGQEVDSRSIKNPALMMRI
jgi:hypothetical protein